MPTDTSIEARAQGHIEDLAKIDTNANGCDGWMTVRAGGPSMRTQFYVPRSRQGRAQLFRTTATEPISQPQEHILGCSYLHDRRLMGEDKAGTGNPTRLL